MNDDLSGWCTPRAILGWARHKECDGILHSATGYHWWCICQCHGEVPEPPTTEYARHRAWTVWRKANVQRRASGPIQTEGRS